MDKIIARMKEARRHNIVLAILSAPNNRLCLTESYRSELFGKAVWLSLRKI